MAAAALVVIVLIVGSGASAPPAYAFTKHANGTYTIMLRDLTTGIPGLNAAFHKHHIAETVIPITSACPVRSGFLGSVHPNPMYETSNDTYQTTYSPQRARAHPAEHGFHYILAAKRLDNGKLLTLIGQIREPIPPCLHYDGTPSDVLP
jgi:hypothetical protein